MIPLSLYLAGVLPALPADQGQSCGLQRRDQPQPNEDWYTTVSPKQTNINHQQSYCLREQRRHSMNVAGLTFESKETRFCVRSDRATCFGLHSTTLRPHIISIEWFEWDRMYTWRAQRGSSLPSDLSSLRRVLWSCLDSQEQQQDWDTCPLNTPVDQGRLTLADLLAKATYNKYICHKKWNNISPSVQKRLLCS